MPLDEATTAFLRKIAKGSPRPLHELGPAAARAATRSMKPLYGSGPDVAAVTGAEIPGPAGPVPALVIRPPAAPAGVLVYFHGGGWVLGSADEFEALGRELACRTGCVVVLPDYRLAPEHRFPAAVDDAWSAVVWAGEQRADLAGASVPLLVAGDSAGGNLAAVVCRRARDEGAPPIAMQVLIYPVTDCDFETGSYRAPENQLMFGRDTLRWFWDQYAPTPESRSRPECAPARAQDFGDLPPAVVVTAEHDVLRDEGESYAKLLDAAGVEVAHRRFGGQMHGFFSMVNVLPGSARALEFVATEVIARIKGSDGAAERGGGDGPGRGGD